MDVLKLNADKFRRFAEERARREQEEKERALRKAERLRERRETIMAEKRKVQHVYGDLRCVDHRFWACAALFLQELSMFGLLMDIDYAYCAASNVFGVRVTVEPYPKHYVGEERLTLVFQFREDPKRGVLVGVFFGEEIYFRSKANEINALVERMVYACCRNCEKIYDVWTDFVEKVETEEEGEENHGNGEN